ncbi:MAG: phosphatase PAP2 family protein [Ilumatobacteraceae bacterium]
MMGLLLGLFGVLLIDVWIGGPLSKLDGNVATRMNRVDVSHPLIVDAARWATVLGSTPVLVPMVFATSLYSLLVQHRRRQGLFVIATAVGGLIVNNAIKLVVGRNRPAVANAVAHAAGKSFPSGHAMNSAVIYGALLVVAMWNVRVPRRRWALTAGALLLVGLIAASRVVLVVHYITDVVAGVSLGAALVIISVKAFTRPSITSHRIWIEPESPR